MTTLKIECLETLEILDTENHPAVQGGLSIRWDRPFPIPYPPKYDPKPPYEAPKPKPWPPSKPTPCQCVTTPCYCAYPLPPWGPVIL